MIVYHLILDLIDAKKKNKLRDTHVEGQVLVHVNLVRFKAEEERYRHITSHHITSHHITSRHVTSRHTTSYHITSRHVTSRHITSRHNTSHHNTSRYITSYHITSRHGTSHHVTSRHVTSRHVTSHHITSHHITSHHITLCHITITCFSLHLKKSPAPEVSISLLNIQCSTNLQLILMSKKGRLLNQDETKLGETLIYKCTEEKSLGG